MYHPVMFLFWRLPVTSINAARFHGTLAIGIRSLTLRAPANVMQPVERSLVGHCELLKHIYTAFISELGLPTLQCACPLHTHHRHRSA